jgi:Protein kinase domain
VGEQFRPALGGFAAGSQVASYEIVEQIGRGGMAVVYRARDLRLNRWVALKILVPELALDDVFRQRFIRESRAAAAVDHPNIIPIFEAGEASGVLFIAMRYVSGQDVRSLIDRAGALPPARAAGIIMQVASALDAAHARGLVHRDVKPANMLLSGAADGSGADHVYLSDFGVSKQSDATSGLTRTGQLVGTLDYLAPEQVEGRPADGRADVYSLACAAFEMLSGAPPFKRDQSLAVMWAQLSAPPPALTSRRPGLPPAVDPVMTKALAKAPGDRYATCGGFASALHAACGLRAGSVAGPGATTPGLGGFAPGPPTSQPVRPRPPAKRRSPAKLAAAAALAAAVILAGGAFALHRGLAPRPAAGSGSLSSATSPAAVVRMYFSAINHHAYAQAWRLGGKNSGSTYPGFVRGLSTTRRDDVTIVSVSGDVVTARVTALQADGTVKIFQGTYTVAHGTIARFDIRRVG